MNQNADEKATGGRRAQGRTAAEWTMFAVTLAVILAVAGAVVWSWLSGASSPPRFTISPGQSPAGSTHVPVQITNTGTETAINVTVAAEGGDQPRTQTVDYLHGGETVQVVFVTPPRTGLTFSVSSFELPG